MSTVLNSTEPLCFHDFFSRVGIGVGVNPAGVPQDPTAASVAAAAAVASSSSMAGTSQANWSSPPPGATLNYTANQSMTPASAAQANNSNVTSEWNFAAGGNPAQRASQQRSEAQGLLSTSPMPEFWCSILYFELDTQVIKKN